MREQFKRLNDPREPSYTMATKLNLPPGYLLIHRTWLGSIGLLSQLEAEAPFRQILERVPPGVRRGVSPTGSVSRPRSRGSRASRRTGHGTTTTGERDPR